MQKGDIGPLQRTPYGGVAQGYKRKFPPCLLESCPDYRTFANLRRSSAIHPRLLGFWSSQHYLRPALDGYEIECAKEEIGWTTPIIVVADHIYSTAVTLQRWSTCEIIFVSPSRTAWRVEEGRWPIMDPDQSELLRLMPIETSKYI